MTSYDVAIVGAGVHGASAAFHLAQRGVRVALVEKGTPASGPTGRSSAVLRGYYVNDFLAQATRESVQMFRDFTELTHGGEARYVPCGALFMHAEEDGGKLHDTVQRLVANGTKVEVLDVDLMADQFPQFDLEGIAYGVWEEVAGHADPAGTTNGFVDRAVALGATLKRYTTVTGITRRASGYDLATDGGDIVQAERVLLAVGPWTSQLLGLAGVTDIPLWAERHLIATYGWGPLEPLPFVWASVPDGIYFKPEVHAQYLLGTLLPEPPVDPDDFDEELAPEEQLDMTERLLTRAPVLAESELRGGYCGLYDVAPDWQPVIGEVDDGLFVVAGTAGHGFKWAPAVGRHVADLVSGLDVDQGLAQFSPQRFRNGTHLDAGFGNARIIG